jgi:hypothetical protein
VRKNSSIFPIFGSMMESLGMNLEFSMKKALKVIAVVVGIFLFVFIVAFVLILQKLPSSWEVKQALSSRKVQNPEFVAKSAPVNPQKPGEPLPEKKMEALARTNEDRADEGKELGQRAVKEDFLNEQKPLASVCAHLDKASSSKFLRSDDEASSKEFLTKMLDNDKDPLAESAAPLFRYVLRLPQVKELIAMVEQAQAEHAGTILKKAEFYGQIGLAGQEVRSNKAEIDRMLMKTYNMYILSRAVGKHPELARDPATLSFCEQIEKNINLNLDFNPDQQAEELSKFLDYAKVPPEEVGYDPKMRSDVQFKIDNGSLLLKNIWIEKLFAADMKKATKQLEKSTQLENN